MPKLDLSTALNIKMAGGEIVRLKGSTFNWIKPNPSVTLPGLVTVVSAEPTVRGGTMSWQEPDLNGTTPDEIRLRIRTGAIAA